MIEGTSRSPSICDNSMDTYTLPAKSSKYQYHYGCWKVGAVKGGMIHEAEAGLEGGLDCLTLMIGSGSIGNQMAVNLVIATPFGYPPKKIKLLICAAKAMTPLPLIPYSLQSARLRSKKS